MESQKNTADKVRHILEAMDRSIDDARRRRLNKPTEPEVSQAQQATFGHRVGQADPPATSTNGNGVTPLQQQPTQDGPLGPDNPPRFKARPKRPSAFGGNNHGNGQSYSSRVG